MGQIGRMGFHGTSGDKQDGDKDPGGGKPSRGAGGNDRAKSNERFRGKPWEVKEVRLFGYDHVLQMDGDGKAVVERHITDHGKPKIHSNPHDHIITWVKRERDGKEHIQWGKYINYRNGERIPNLEEFLP
jgi:hypothetical protein